VEGDNLQTLARLRVRGQFRFGMIFSVTVDRDYRFAKKFGQERSEISSALEVGNVSRLRANEAFKLSSKPGRTGSRCHVSGAHRACARAFGTIHILCFRLPGCGVDYYLNEVDGHSTRVSIPAPRHTMSKISEPPSTLTVCAHTLWSENRC